MVTARISFIIMASSSLHHAPFLLISVKVWGLDGAISLTYNIVGGMVLSLGSSLHPVIILWGINYTLISPEGIHNTSIYIEPSCNWLIPLVSLQSIFFCNFPVSHDHREHNYANIPSVFLRNQVILKQRWIKTF